MAITLPNTGQSTITASNDCGVTFSGYTPVLGDVVHFYICSGATTPALFNISGWIRWRDTTPRVTSDAHWATHIYHVVTQAEVDAVTTTYNATNIFDANMASGHVLGVVMRGADTSVLTGDLTFKASQSSNTNNASPHVAPGISSPTIEADYTVIRFYVSDGTGTYTPPSGHTSVIVSSSGQLAEVYVQDALTQAGVNIAAANATPSAGDEYACISEAFKPAPPAPTSLNPPVRRPNYGGLFHF